MSDVSRVDCEYDRLQDKVDDETKAWLLARKEEALRIDPETAEVSWCYGQIMDPYHVFRWPPEGRDCAGRQYFVRRPGGDILVWTGDLPEDAHTKIYEKIKEGSCVFEDSGAGEQNCALAEQAFAKQFPDKAARVGRGFQVRSTAHEDGGLCIRPDDEADTAFVLAVVTANASAIRFAGWQYGTKPRPALQ